MKKQNLSLIILLAALFLSTDQAQFTSEIASAQSPPTNQSQNSTSSTLTPEQMQMILSLQAALDADKPEILREMMAYVSDPNRSAPYVVILSLSQNQTFSLCDNVTLHFTVNQLSNCSYRLNNQEKTAITGNSTLRGLPAGNQSLIIYAQNAAGKVGSSQPVNFTVIQPIQLEAKPLHNAISITLVDAFADACFAAALGLTVATYCWRRKKRSN